MNAADAQWLLADAVPRQTGVWADFGAGEGTFTRALVALLGPGSRIYAVDRDPGSLAVLQRWDKRNGADVVPVIADFTRPFALPELGSGDLDGMLLANALHFVRQPEPVLTQLTAWLRPGGRAVIVEYDGRRANRWIPYPVPSDQLPPLAAAAGLTPPVVTATRASAFGGELYVAAATRRG